MKLLVLCSILKFLNWSKIKINDSESNNYLKSTQTENIIYIMIDLWRKIFSILSKVKQTFLKWQTFFLTFFLSIMTEVPFISWYSRENLFFYNFILTTLQKKFKRIWYYWFSRAKSKREQLVNSHFLWLYEWGNWALFIIIKSLWSNHQLFTLHTQQRALLIISQLLGFWSVLCSKQSHLSKFVHRKLQLIAHRIKRRRNSSGPPLPQRRRGTQWPASRVNLRWTTVPPKPRKQLRRRSLSPIFLNLRNPEELLRMPTVTWFPTLYIKSFLICRREANRKESWKN